MGRLTERLDRVAFHCRACGARFDAVPERVVDAPDEVAHPWLYFADCLTCGEEASQAAWERNLMKAHANATGPTTPEGKAAVTRNLEGHPTPEEAQRTRFNAMKHGMTARTATYFPAKPGKYPDCEHCQYRLDCSVADRACRKRVELFMRTHIAFDTRDPKLLTELNADIQSNIMAIMQNMLITIVADGVALRQPAWYYDKDGGLHWVEKIDPDSGEVTPVIEIQAHPLLKPLRELLAANGMTLTDLAMTPRVVESVESEMGQLDHQAQSREQLLEYSRRQTEAVEGLQALVDRGRARLARDPVLLEHDSNG